MSCQLRLLILALDKFAPAVDSVWMEQLQRLKRFAETGSPE